jgi:hypothetical protein
MYATPLFSVSVQLVNFVEGQYLLAWTVPHIEISTTTTTKYFFIPYSLENDLVNCKNESKTQVSFEPKSHSKAAYYRLLSTFDYLCGNFFA